VGRIGAEGLHVVKKCGYCGLENNDEQMGCSQCGTPFERAPMTAEQRATVIMGIGFVFQYLSRYILKAGDPPTPWGWLGLAMLVAGVGTMVWGCTRYAFLKGYPRWLGLLGLLSCFGAIVLYFLPKRPRETVGAEGSVGRPR
jgi:hypothetical protein